MPTNLIKAGVKLTAVKHVNKQFFCPSMFSKDFKIKDHVEYFKYPG